MKRKHTPTPPPVQPLTLKLAYGVEEAAELLSISRSKLYILVRDGKIRTVKAGGRTIISHQSLVDFLSAS